MARRRPVARAKRVMAARWSGSSAIVERPVAGDPAEAVLWFWQVWDLRDGGELALCVCVVEHGGDDGEEPVGRCWCAGSQQFFADGEQFVGGDLGDWLAGELFGEPDEADAVGLKAGLVDGVFVHPLQGGFVPGGYADVAEL